MVASMLLLPPSDSLRIARMTSILSRVALACAFVLSLSASGATVLDYNGADAGVLVYSSGTIEIPMNVTFNFRRIALPTGEKVKDWEGAIGCRCVGFRGAISDADYTGRETGRVITRNLPPGRYEIYNFMFSGAYRTTSSAKRFSIPFEIKAGEATYIGNFARAASLGTVLQPALGANGYYIISDKSDRDLPIAQARNKNLPPVRKEVIDVAELDHPAIRATEAEKLQPKRAQ